MSFFPPFFLSYLHIQDREARAAERQTSIKKRQTHHLTSQGADRQTDTEKHRQGPPYSTNILSWCRAEEHDMENVTPSLVLKKKKTGTRRNFPLQTFSAVTNMLAASFLLLYWVCLAVFSYACRWAGVKRPLPLQFCC